ncbi:MAG TPA: helix-turn-helix domain-containing protein [Aestuariivirgaceae bacterium]|nr:helix-turn-helix domain-containing protein [Aestuariivirgaceae bacterium]
MADAANRGALAVILEDLRQRGGFKGRDVANLVAVSPATVSRWSSGQAMPHPRTQLLIADLKYTVDRLAESYSPAETRLWLYSRHPLLDGKRPIDLIHESETERVLSVIESLDASEYA